VVFESAVVIFFFYYTGEGLTPTYIKWLQRKIKGLRIKQIDAKENQMWEKDENKMTDEVDSIDERQEQQQQGKALKSSPTPYAGVSYKIGMDVQVPENGNDNNQLNGILRQRGTSVKFDESTNVGERFDHLDRRDSLENTRNDWKSAKSITFDRRESLADTRNDWKSDKSMVRMADAGGFKNEEEAEMNAYWQGVSGYVDEGARLIIPVAYCVFMWFIFEARS